MYISARFPCATSSFWSLYINRHYTQKNHRKTKNKADDAYTQQYTLRTYIGIQMEVMQKSIE